MGRGQVSGSGDQGDSVSDNIEVSTLGNGVDGSLEANISASGDGGISVSGNDRGFPMQWARFQKQVMMGCPNLQTTVLLRLGTVNFLRLP